MDLTQSYIYTVGMDDEEVAARLRDRRTGVLSLAAEGDPYAAPVSYAVDDGGSVFLRLGDDRKRRHLDSLADGAEVCFLVYEDRPVDESWSVVLRGSLVEVDESVVPDTFGVFHLFDEDVDDLSLRYFRLLETERTGRRACD